MPTMLGVRALASAVAGGTRSIALHAAGAAARHRVRPALSSSSSVLGHNPVRRCYSVSPFARGGGATVGDKGTPSEHSAAAPARRSLTRTFFVQRRGTKGFAKLLTTVADVGDLLEEIKKKLELTAPLDSITLQLASEDGTLFTAKDADGKEQPVTLNSMDTVDEALLKAMGRPATPKERLRVIVDVPAASLVPSVGAGHQPIVPPPSFDYPVDSSVSSAIESVAALVSSDIAASGNLEEQRAMAGPLLRKPFPISRLESTPGGEPGLAAEFLPYKGSHAAYSEALLRISNVSAAQKRHVVAVIQASGSGKTRLAYADGQESRLVVVARVWKQAQTYTPAWARFDELAAHWASLMPHLDKSSRLAVSKDALAAMRLLAACHVRFVAEVLQRLRVGQAAPTASSDASAMLLREAALRCLRNGKGDNAVGSLFLQQLRGCTSVRSLAKTPASSAPQADVPVTFVDNAAVERFCLETDRQLRGLLWPGAEVAIWWDEAHALMRSPAVFEPFSQSKQPDSAAVSQLQDGFYGLTALCADLTDNYRWLQSLCGTWLEVATRVDLPKVSPLRGRITTVFHASHISVDQMMETLHNYLVVDADTEVELRPQLELLVGRPIFFFSDFMPAVWGKLLAERPSTAAALREVLKRTADNATDEAYRRLADVIGSMWVTKPSVLPCGISSRSLCTQLYAALRMNGGTVTLKGGAGADALREGVLVLPLISAEEGVLPTKVNLHDEPMCARVLQKIGDNLVRASDDNPSNDPIFQLLGTSMKQGSIAGFSITSSVKGDVLELAFAWHLIRCVLLNPPASDQSAPTLSAALCDLSPPGFCMPTRASKEHLVASTGFSCKTSAGNKLADGLTHLHRLCEDGAERRVLYDIQGAAGADVATLTVGPDGSAASVVMVQAKAQKAASLVECLRAASPAWQFIEEKERKAAIAGLDFEPSAARVSFEKIATGPAATAARFSSAFRIALSVTGFRPQSIAAINALNELPEGSERSPIILCEPSERAFGKQLAAQLLSSCNSGVVTKGTAALAFLLPQQVDNVTKGKVDKHGSPDVQSALRGNDPSWP